MRFPAVTGSRGGRTHYLQSLLRSCASVARSLGVHSTQARRAREEYQRALALEMPLARDNVPQDGPLISIIMPVYNTRPEWLEAAVQSVLEQSYTRWELCIADDASERAETVATLKSSAARDPRITVIWREQRGHICAASNSALAAAHGEFVALLDHDDLFHQDALAYVARSLEQHPHADLLYTDEDWIDECGARVDPAVKPEWSPEYLLSLMYVGHLTVHRRALIEECGRFRLGFEGSQDYDLVLRVSEKAREIVRVPRPLYHWRRHLSSVSANVFSKAYAFAAGERAISEACRRRTASPLEVIETGAPTVRSLRAKVFPWQDVQVVSVDSDSRFVEETVHTLRAWEVSAQLESLPAQARDFAEVLLSLLTRSNAPVMLLMRSSLRIAPSRRFSSFRGVFRGLTGNTTNVATDVREGMLRLAAYLTLPGVAMVGGAPLALGGLSFENAGGGGDGEGARYALGGIATDERGPGARALAAHNVGSLSTAFLMARTESLRRIGSRLRSAGTIEQFEARCGELLRAGGERLVLNPLVRVALRP